MRFLFFKKNINILYLILPSTPWFLVQKVAPLPELDCMPIYRSSLLLHNAMQHNCAINTINIFKTLWHFYDRTKCDRHSDWRACTPVYTYAQTYTQHIWHKRTLAYSHKIELETEEWSSLWDSEHGMILTQKGKAFLTIKNSPTTASISNKLSRLSPLHPVKLVHPRFGVEQCQVLHLLGIATTNRLILPYHFCYTPRLRS